MNFGELYLALKQNVVDGQENPLPTIKSGKFDEVQKYLVLSGHIITPRLVVVNEAFWQGLSPADRKIIEDAVQGGHRLAERRADQAGRDAGRHVQGRRHDGDHAGRQGVPRRRSSGQGAEDVRVEVGRRHVRADPGRCS